MRPSGTCFLCLPTVTIRDSYAVGHQHGVGGGHNCPNQIDRWGDNSTHCWGPKGARRGFVMQAGPTTFDDLIKYASVAEESGCPVIPAAAAADTAEPVQQDNSSQTMANTITNCRGILQAMKSRVKSVLRSSNRGTPLTNRREWRQAGMEAVVAFVVDFTMLTRVVEDATSTSPVRAIAYCNNSTDKNRQQLAEVCMNNSCNHRSPNWGSSRTHRQAIGTIEKDQHREQTSHIVRYVQLGEGLVLSAANWSTTTVYYSWPDRRIFTLHDGMRGLSRTLWIGTALSPKHSEKFGPNSPNISPHNFSSLDSKIIKQNGVKNYGCGRSKSEVHE